MLQLVVLKPRVLEQQQGIDYTLIQAQAVLLLHLMLLLQGYQAISVVLVV
jgi:hypothetical protein